MMEAWQSAVDECGDFWGLGTYTLTEKTSGATLDVEGEFQIRNATISFAFDENMNIESMDIGGHYELSEILQKAALNTVLGMGTVFVVLIFISFIISLFRFIPMLEAALSKKKTPVQIEAKQVPSTEVMVENEVDDGELVAVIAAAIAMSEGTSTDDFVVRSIKRRRSNNWN
jgi:sodium pump decarboxylase gamma subunit